MSDGGRTRRRGATGLAAYIRNRTGGGEALAEALLEIVEDVDHKDRMEAIRILLDRGFGKPTQSVDLQAKIDKDDDRGELRLNLDRLSVDELKEALLAIQKLRGTAEPSNGDELEGEVVGGVGRGLEYSPAANRSGIGGVVEADVSGNASVLGGVGDRAGPFGGIDEGQEGIQDAPLPGDPGAEEPVDDLLDREGEDDPPPGEGG